MGCGGDEIGPVPRVGNHRVGNPGYNNTKSAFADYAAAMTGEPSVVRPISRRAKLFALHTKGGDESAKADFVGL